MSEPAGDQGFGARWVRVSETPMGGPADDSRSVPVARAGDNADCDPRRGLARWLLIRRQGYRFCPRSTVLMCFLQSDTHSTLYPRATMDFEYYSPK